MHARHPEATVIIPMAEERAELRAWRVRRRRSTGCGSGRGLCCWRGRRGEPSDRTGGWIHSGTASKWRVRYAEKRLAGLDETGERGAEPKYTTATNKRILALLDHAAGGLWRWTGPLLAAALDDVDVQYVWRFLRAQKIDLAGRKSWCESNDPAFVAEDRRRGRALHRHRPRTPSSSALTRSP